MADPLLHDLARIRAELPITEHCRYFNTGWAGPECRAGIAAQVDMITWLNTHGISHHTAPRLNELTERVRAQVARLVRADPDCLVLTRGVVDGLNLVLNGLSWSPDDHVVTTNIEHSGGLVPLYALRDRYGVDVGVADINDLQDMAGKIDAACTDRTRLILCSHVSYNMGVRLPLEDIVRRAHARGIRVLVDGAQSVGVFPVDVTVLGADFYALPGHKWLLGPECTGALYLAPGQWESLALTQPGYGSVTQSDPEGGYTLHPNVRRFEGIDHDPVALAGWEAALRFMAEFDQSAIAARIGQLTARLQDQLAGRTDLRVPTPPDFARAAGLVGVGLEPPGAVRALATALLADGFIVRHVLHPAMLRVSVNFFNTEDEVDALAEAIVAGVS